MVIRSQTFVLGAWGLLLACSDPAASSPPPEVRKGPLDPSLESRDVCDDGNPCTLDLRRAQGCVHLPVDDHSPCTTGLCPTRGECVQGVCEIDHPCDDHNPCTTERCSLVALRYQCVVLPVADRTACDDTNACTQNDSCREGRCDGVPITCDDSNACTSDRCESSVGCVFTPQTGQACDDANACTVGDSCSARGECGGHVRSCDDQNACTTDSCDPASGCSHAPVSCRDQRPCTVDGCDPQRGCTYQPVTCNDNNPCTVDRCRDELGGCQFVVHAGLSCNDQSACSRADACQADGSCRGVQVDPDDANPCTADACDPTTGVSHTDLDLGLRCGNDPRLRCDGDGVCVALQQGQPIGALQEHERRLGSGGHVVAASNEALAVVYAGMDQQGTYWVGAELHDLLGVAQGSWRRRVSVSEPGPVVAALSDGGFAVTYHDFGHDGDGLGVVVVRLDAKGNELEAPRVVNQTLELGQHSADAVVSDGALWIAWQDDSETGTWGGTRICLRSFSLTLQPRGAQRCVGEAGTRLDRLRLGEATKDPLLSWLQQSRDESHVVVQLGTERWSIETQPGQVIDTPAAAMLDDTHVGLVSTERLGTQTLRILTMGGHASDPVELNTSPTERRWSPRWASSGGDLVLAYIGEEDGVLVHAQHLRWRGGRLNFVGTPKVAGQQGQATELGITLGAIGPDRSVWTAWTELKTQGTSGRHDAVRATLRPLDGEGRTNTGWETRP